LQAVIATGDCIRNAFDRSRRACAITAAALSGREQVRQGFVHVVDFLVE